jgi:hypothetical protein
MLCFLDMDLHQEKLRIFVNQQSADIMQSSGVWPFKISYKCESTERNFPIYSGTIKTMYCF